MGRRNGNKQRDSRRASERGKERRPQGRRHENPEDYEEREEDKAYEALHDARATETLKAKYDEHQMKYYKAARMGTGLKVIIIDEKAGTGKTTVAWSAAIEALRTGKVKRVTYIRFPSKRGQKLGALPGELAAKEAIYMQPAYEALAACGLQEEIVDRLRLRGIVRLSTDVTLRGTNMAEEFVIIDEAQNAEDIEQLKLVLTRLHDSSKALLIGDSGQRDGGVKLYGGEYNAFQVYTMHLLKKPWAARFRLLNNYRGDIAQHADAIDETLKEIERGLIAL